MSAQAPRAVVLVSGGLDSAVTLAIARDEGFECFALTFDYGQRHRIEIDAARRVAQALKAKEHVVMIIDLRAVGGSALTDNIEVPKKRMQADGPARTQARGSRSAAVKDEIPLTYVPARNTIFLSLALAYAEVLGAADIFIGVNAVDYSGYPDCRPAFIAAFERLGNLATRTAVEGRRLKLHTPLIHLSKAQIIQRGIGLGVDFSMTHSCYDPDPHSGAACGECDSCLLRAAGFKAAGANDPARQ